MIHVNLVLTVALVLGYAHLAHEQLELAAERRAGATEAMTYRVVVAADIAQLAGQIADLKLGLMQAQATLGMLTGRTQWLKGHQDVLFSHGHGRLRPMYAGELTEWPKLAGVR